MSIDRRRLAALVKGAVHRSGSGRLLTDLVPRNGRNPVLERMPPEGRCVLLGVMAGDEQHSVTSWWIPGIGRRELIVKRSTLADLVAAAPDVLENDSNTRSDQLELFG